MMLTKAELLQNAIINEIREGRYREGDKIPSRHQLCRKFNCSRNTVERAVVFLIEQGWLSAKQGRSTVVHRKNIKKTNSQFEQIFFVTNNKSMRLDDEAKNAFPGNSTLPAPVTVLNPIHITLNMHKIKNSHSAVIWIIPGYEQLHMIDHLATCKIPQLLTNRRFSKYNFAMTDYYASILEGLQHLIKASGKEIAFAAFRENTLIPYQSERIIAFFELCCSLNIQLRHEHIYYDDVMNQGSNVPALRKNLFKHKNHPRGIFVMNMQHIQTILDIAEEYGKIPGKDFHLLCFDSHQAFAGRAGIIMLKQRFEKFYSEAFRWIDEGFATNGTPFYSLIKTELILPD